MTWYENMFGQGKRKTFTDHLLESFSEDVMEVIQETAKDVAPDLQKQAAEAVQQARAGMKEGLIDAIKKYQIDNDDVRAQAKTQTEALFNSFLQSILTQAPELKNNPETTTKLERLTTTRQQCLENGIRFSTVDVKTYRQKMEKAKKLAKLVFGKHTELRIAMMGDTQQGKTAFVALISGEKHRKIKKMKTTGNMGKKKTILGSDTIDAQEYVLDRNGMKLIFGDLPGWNDSREGQEEQNETTRNKYFRDHQVDIVIHATKLGSFPTESSKKYLKKFSERFQDKVIQKTIVILTYANTAPIPPEIREEAFFKLHPELNEDEDEVNIDSPKYPDVLIEARRIFIELGIATWREYYRSVNPDVEVPICPVENDIVVCPHSDEGIPLLYDRATPFIEDTMCRIFEKVSTDKKPLTFLALAKERTSENKDQPGPLTTHERSLHQATDRIMKTIITGTVAITNGDDSASVAGAGASAAGTGGAASAAGTGGAASNDDGWCSVL